MKASDYIVNYIAALGISHVFTLAGGHSMHLNDSFEHHPNITPVYMLDERGAAIAAEAYAKASGKLGICVVTAGPGVTNALTGCAAAYLESTPVIFISGDAKTDDLHRRDRYGLRQAAQQDIPTIEVVKPITKIALEAQTADEIPDLLDELIKTALIGRPGPVWLSVPLDIQAQDIANDEIVPPTIARPVLLPGDIDEITEVLKVAKRPIILFGAGVINAHARAEATELVNYLGIPVLTTWPASDLIPYHHNLFIGHPGPVGLRAGNKVLQECDLLISIGARLDPATCCYNVAGFGKNAIKVQVDIDPKELDKNEDAIHYPVLADAGYFICAMQRRALPFVSNGWVEHCGEIKAKYLFEALGNAPTYSLVNILNEITTADDIFANGTSSCACNIFSVGWKPKAGQRMFATHALGSMGCDIPNAIGACLGSGGRHTICITGDGSVMQNIQELEVVRRLQLPIAIFVANNGGYGCVERSQGRAFKRWSGVNESSGLTLPSAANIAEAIGIDGQILEHIEKDADIIKMMLGSSDPCVIEYFALDEPELPHVITTIDANGMPHTSPIDKMWPDE